MIDIHTHILPHMDDGAKNTRMSVAMLEKLQQQGATTVVFTPHFYGRRSSPDEFFKRRNNMFEHIREQIPAGLETRLGAELHFTGINMPENDVLCKFAIDGTKYVLVEFPFTTVWTGSLLERLSQFVYDTDYTPIIAHVERYQEVQKKPSLLADLVNMGCLLQVNTTSFLQKQDKKLAFTLLKHGFVHCLGTDAHDTENRAPDYIQAKQAIEAAGYGADFQRIQENMQAILRNERVNVPEYRPLKKILGFYM